MNTKRKPSTQAQTRLRLHSPKPISSNMISQLRWIDSHDVPVEYLGELHQGTIGALLGPAREYVQRQGNRLAVTREGRKVIDAYKEARAIRRLHPGDMTERVAAMVRFAKARQRAA